MAVLMVLESSVFPRKIWGGAGGGRGRGTKATTGIAVKAEANSKPLFQLPMVTRLRDREQAL